MRLNIFMNNFQSILIKLKLIENLHLSISSTLFSYAKKLIHTQQYYTHIFLTILVENLIYFYSCTCGRNIFY